MNYSLKEAASDLFWCIVAGVIATCFLGCGVVMGYAMAFYQ